jgi:hypothetical protein
VGSTIAVGVVGIRLSVAPVAVGAPGTATVNVALVMAPVIRAGSTPPVVQLIAPGTTTNSTVSAAAVGEMYDVFCPGAPIVIVFAPEAAGNQPWKRVTPISCPAVHLVQIETTIVWLALNVICKTACDAPDPHVPVCAPLKEPTPSAGVNKKEIVVGHFTPSAL